MASLLGRKSKKKAQLELNNELPFFDVRYLGRSLTRTKMGRECTKSVVSDLVKKAHGCELQTVSLTISSRGIWVTEKSGQGNGRETFIPIYSVTYGAADKVFQNVFTIVTTYQPRVTDKADKSEGQDKDSGGSGNGSLNGSNGSASVNCKGNNVEDFKALKSAKASSSEVFVCHAFLCRDPVLARAMVVYLLKAFKVAFESWSRCVKSEKLRERIKAGPGLTTASDQSKDGKGERRKSHQELLTMDPAVKPPEETAALVDKVAAWMDKWFHFGNNHNKKQNEIFSADEPASDPHEFEEFSKRMMEFSDPTLLNFDIDIEAELKDVEVCSILNEVVSREPAPKADEPNSSADAGSGDVLV
ncbi:uncharacterized protein LOC119730333 [Patiria miniata]|uniref:PID domain-containing protein n=1 Tax=Patiria miniata TaxID=46514 RepID=A0A914A6J2_PATMI|nr:uncharacterized protein LOC119730333 [Patiria miniata]XP_038059100.1 uncharacterized protein LOC119730333 [Patiria miniata]XP_038059101.1 uncharacterized protein LOC119730333 [Patiria miniata]